MDLTVVPISNEVRVGSVTLRKRRVGRRQVPLGTEGGARPRPGRYNVVVPEFTEPLRYRIITGPDDAEFCARVSGLLDEGYELYGSPAVTFDGARVITAQALVFTGRLGSAPPRS